MKRKSLYAANTRIAKRTEEWDFRGVKEELLHLAIAYEYARSSNWVLDLFAKWHAERLKLPSRSDGYSTWNGKKVSDVLNYLRMSLESLPQDVSEALFQTYPETFSESVVGDLTDISIHFPEPFVHIANSITPQLLEHLKPRWQRCGFKILESFPKYSKRQIESSAKAGIHYLSVEIDLNVGKDKLAKDAKKALVTLFTRKAPNLPWFHLKELAAYRLSRAGWSFETAWEFLTEYEKDETKQKLLPIYETAGWWGAVNNAKKRIEELYPPPT